MQNNRSLKLHQAYADHDRHWRDLLFCYPVVSRRSKGLSIGVNLNPDKACNFDCIYCQVDRTTPPTIRKVDLDIVRRELAALLNAAIDGTLFTAPPFDALPAEQRVLRDIAFSGDGEPTTFPRFDDAVRLVADLRRERNLNDAKIVLITDACYLTKPAVAAGLAIMDDNNGEIWAKLDAGTQAYYEIINRPSHTLAHILAEIRETARKRPVVIQSLWMRVHGQPPTDGEVRAFADRLGELFADGAKLKLIQIYTIARRTTEEYATPLTPGELERVAQLVAETVKVPIETFKGIDP